MSLIQPVHVVVGILFLQALRIASLPEEAFYGYAPQAAEDDYVYVDGRADPTYSGASAFKQSETHRRSILDKNFARFGRASGATQIDADAATDVDAFARGQRSGERSDQFIRFGRGRSDFVRFGRRSDGGGGYRFIRFGRSAAPNANAKMADRKKRSPDADVYKKGGSNFVRFGRDRNDNFMRFGRTLMMSRNRDSTRNNTGDWKKYLGRPPQAGQDLVLKMLVDVLAKTHVRNELQQLHAGQPLNQTQSVKETYCRCNGETN